MLPFLNGLPCLDIARDVGFSWLGAMDLDTDGRYEKYADK